MVFYLNDAVRVGMYKHRTSHCSDSRACGPGRISPDDVKTCMVERITLPIKEKHPSGVKRGAIVDSACYESLLRYEYTRWGSDADV